MKFKAGDIVRNTKSFYGMPSGTVSRVTSANASYLAINGSFYSDLESNFELVEVIQIGIDEKGNEYVYYGPPK